MTGVPEFTLRPATPEDEEFLFALFLSARTHELTVLPEAQRAPLMRMQFRGQQLTYSSAYSQAGHSIVLVDSIPAGRVWISEDAEALHVVDIALLPAHRNAGIGTAIYRELMSRAAHCGKKVSCSVAGTNPGSRRFHERLGFRRKAGDGMYFAMEWFSG